MTRIQVLQRVLDTLGGSRYLELGVRDGSCFRTIRADTKVAVDPRFAFEPPLTDRLRTVLRRPTGSLYFRTTSDRFFGRHGRRLAPFDVVFVDGLHTYEQAYRDVLNALAVLRPGGAVVVHDSSPSSEAAAAPSLALAARTPGFRGEWNGDVYKAIVRLRTHPDLRVSVLDTDQGMAIVMRGRPEARLALSADAIQQLDYEALDCDRRHLLDLRPKEELDVILAANRAAESTVAAPTIRPCRGSR